MTTQETNALTHRVEEFFEDYIVFGFVHGTDEPKIMGKAHNAKSALAINALVANFLGGGGISLKVVTEETPNEAPNDG